MAELKREYVVPLRRKSRFAPKWRRSKKAVSVLREFIQKHMKTEHVIVGEELNEFLWARGARHPPGKVSVIALRKEVNGVASTVVNLSSVGVDKQLEKYNMIPESQKKEEVQEAEVTEKPETEASEEKTEEKKAEVKKEEKPAQKKTAQKKEGGKKE